MVFHQLHNSRTNYNFNTAFYSDTVWDSHFHKNLELIYVINGSVRCTVNNLSFQMNAGDFGLCLPYDIHSYEPYKDSSYWILVFSGDFVHSFSKEIAGKHGNKFIFEVSAPVKAYIKDRLIYNENPTKYTLKSCLYGICEEYVSSVKLVEKDRKRVEIIAFIADYIAEKYTESISLMDVACAFGYDYNYMSRCFKSVFNMSFTSFVNLYRLEAAIALLDNTDASITEIALKSGFQSVRNFNDCFKKHLHTTPSQYRKAVSKQ